MLSKLQKVAHYVADYGTRRVESTTVQLNLISTTHVNIPVSLPDKYTGSLTAFFFIVKSMLSTARRFLILELVTNNQSRPK